MVKKKVQPKQKESQLVIYKDKRGNVEFRADVNHETIWATQIQIAELFGRDKSVVSRHLKDIFKSGELEQNRTVAKNATVQKEGGREIKRDIEYYNLDAILSVGYRVNSKQATAFRIWATKTLRNYLVKGYVLNAKRLKASQENSVHELEKTLGVIQSAVQARQLNQSEIDGLLSVINGYTNTWLLLQKYDEGSVETTKTTKKGHKQFVYEYVRPAIEELKKNLMKKGEASDLFGNERDPSFGGILKTIYQAFGGKELYGSMEEKSAHLLYFIIKDHPFSDGNKRIGAFLFVLFLDRNHMLYRKNGEKKINDNALVALALLVAESKPNEKEQIVALVTNLLR